VSDEVAASCSWDGTAKLWGLNDGACRATYSEHGEWLRDVRWAPDGQHVATCSGDATVQLWEAETQQQQHVLKGHADWVATCCFVPDTSLLVSAGWDAAVLLWDLTSGLETHRLGEGTLVARHIVSTASQPGHVTLGYVDGSIRIFDVRQPAAPVATMTQHTASITRLVAHGSQLVSASSDETCRVWAGDQCIRTFDAHTAWVSDMAVAHDGTVVSCSGDGMTLVWDVHSGTLLAKGRGPGASLCCAVSCDDESVYVATGAQR
jgi:WD40 repeat protein